MNLDDLEYLKTIDPENMLGHIENLPTQVETAWALGQTLPLPASFERVNKVVICGMGGSAIGGSLAQALVAPECRVPVFVIRDYELPAFVGGPDCLVIASSYSGNTEETLTAFEAAAQRRAQLMAICTGGKLAEMAQQRGAALWTFEYQAQQPRAVVGYSFMLLLAALQRLGRVGEKSADVAEAVAAMRAQQAAIAASAPVVNNPAKRLAGQLMDRIVAVFASGYLAPVARRWKGQISEVAKAWGQFEELPELDHNSVVGTVYPEALVSKFLVLFLRSALDHPRNRLRAEATQELYMLQGFNTDRVEAQGGSPLAQMLTCLHFGDYVAYYLAMAYGVDPTPVPPIEELKARLAGG